MNEGKILDSLKDLLNDKDSIINQLRDKLKRLELDYNEILSRTDLELDEQEARLLQKRTEINKLNDKILKILSGSIESLKKQED